MALISHHPHFQGKFFANPKEVEKLRAHIDALYEKKPTSEDLKYLKEDLEIKDKKYQFDLWVFHVDDETGLFLAEGKDHFGNSAIVGVEEADNIKFQKIYRKTNPKRNIMNPATFHDDYVNFKFIDYYGIILSKKDKIEAGGVYTTRGEDKKDGFWHVESVK